MIIDSLDISILSEIYFNNSGTWEITKKYFPCLKNQREMGGKLNLVKSRLKKMEKLGLIIITKEKDNTKNIKKNVYNLIKEKIKIGKHKFIDGYYDAIVLTTDEGRCAFEIN